MSTSRLDPLDAGRSALARGAWQEARAEFEGAVGRHTSPEAFEGLSWALWWIEDVAACLDAREHAYRLYSRANDTRGAARMALWLGDDHAGFRGEHAVANGWFRRAARLLDEVESSPEHGWLAVFEAHDALDAHDTVTAKQSAALAQELGRRHGAVDLQMFALGTRGVALVQEGEVARGMRCLDEATAAALAGEYENLAPAAWTCCLVMSTCERVRDFDRGAQWCRKIEEFARRMDTRFVTGVCRSHYATILAWRGSWSEAEKELLDATEDLSENRPFWRAEALVRLAELRRRQGRLDEAQELYEQTADHPLAQKGLAELFLERDDPAAARDVVERMLRRIPTESMIERVDALEVQVHAAVALADLASATSHLEELRAIAACVDSPSLHAAADVCAGLVASATGDHQRACDHFEDAIDRYVRIQAPVAAGCARVELAGALHALGRADAARREARVALACLGTVGAAAESARARSLLERLGTRQSRLREADGQLLTPRQVEVLRLVADGLSDRDIAGRLVLSEHTVHRHIANIYTRLGCSSRAAAVARAHRHDLL